VLFDFESVFALLSGDRAYPARAIHFELLLVHQRLGKGTSVTANDEIHKPDLHGKGQAREKAQ
jgi:hypothetical protein